MPGRKSRNKGNCYERELVNQARASGLTAERAFGSNGRALGCSDEVDLLVGQKRIQAKRQKALLKGLLQLASYLEIDDVDAVVFREDGSDQKSLVLMTWWEYLDLIKGKND